MNVIQAIRTENWHRYKVGKYEPPGEYLMRIRAEVAQLENLSRNQWTGPRVWRTHTAPGSCWICDTFGAVHGLLAYLEWAYPQELTTEEKEPLNELSLHTDVNATEQKI